MRIKNHRSGSTVISTIFVTFICIIITISIFFYLFNILNVYMYYQKLNSIALKYMFIIERYGYLTSEEEEKLNIDLLNSNFDIELIDIKAPIKQEPFGTELTLLIQYKIPIKALFIDDVGLKASREYIKIEVEKNCYSKI